ncbi:MAG: hypothetical protein A3E85_00850 [Gammaproteobacteria bacterium RIFCSPHIGHO2_12_FULL_45_12]|nr:MAG: hypothetical protein A3E85_00850 [Gammaproteobacteria bacterium RIFCSPHIGHO2_12_FULL_45_12]
MALKDVLKVSRKTFLNPSAWLSYDSLKTDSKSVWEIVKGLFALPKREEVREETFEQAMERLQLTETQVVAAIRNFRTSAICFALLGLGVFFYSFYLLFSGVFFTAWFLGMAVTTLLFSQAYKYDFWAFQMKRRQLGLTFAEWKRHILGD